MVCKKEKIKHTHKQKEITLAAVCGVHYRGSRTEWRGLLGYCSCLGGLDWRDVRGFEDSRLDLRYILEVESIRPDNDFYVGKEGEGKGVIKVGF